MAKKRVLPIRPPSRIRSIRITLLTGVRIELDVTSRTEYSLCITNSDAVSDKVQDEMLDIVGELLSKTSC